jgi:predicted dehydrogenase
VNRAAPIRFGIVGLGRMGLNHVRVLSLLRGAEIRCVLDSDRQTRERIAANVGARPVSDLADMFGEVDALVIASPTITHAEYVTQAADHVRNLFVEKPLADSLERTVELERIAGEKKLNLQVGFIERFNPAVQQLKKVLGSEPAISIDFNRANKISARITDVDVIIDLMIHDIDLALYLNGPVAHVSANGMTRDGMIEFAVATLTHSNGSFSRVLASRITDKKMRTIQATCRDMFVDCDLLRKEVHISRQANVTQPEGEPYTITALDETLEVPPQEALLLELQAFLASCAETKPGDMPGPEAGRAAMEVCWKVREAITAAR